MTAIDNHELISRFMPDDDDGDTFLYTASGLFDWTGTPDVSNSSPTPHRPPASE